MQNRIILGAKLPGTGLSETAHYLDATTIWPFQVVYSVTFSRCPEGEIIESLKSLNDRYNRKGQGAR